MVSKKIKKLICICSIISIIGGGFTNFTVANAATDNYATPYYENVQSSNSTSTQNNSDNGIPPEMPTNGQGGEMPSGGFSVDKGSEVKTTGVLLVDGTTETKNDQDIISSESNESTVKVTNSGSLTLSDST